MKRPLLVLGALFSIAGASGLIVFGGAIVGVLDGVVTYRVVDPPEPLPASLGEVRWAATSGIALTAGLAISCVAAVWGYRREAISLAGKFLQAAAGLLLVFGAMPVLWGIVGVKRAFNTIATSSAAPTPDELREMVGEVVPAITLGCAVLLAGAVVLLVAGQVGRRARSARADETRSGFGVLVAIGSVVLGAASSLLFVGMGIHGSALEAIFSGASSGAPDVSKLAGHLAGVFNLSLLAFMAVACQGVMHILAAFVASSPGAVSESA